MKKVILLIFCILYLFSMGVMTSAHMDCAHDIEVCFTENSVFSEDEKQIIEEYFVDGINNTATYGLKCTLFGHDYVTEYVDVIRHKVRTTIPRCDREKYEMKICSDCSDTVSTLILLTYIDCCE